MPNRIQTNNRHAIFTGNKAEQQAFRRMYERWTHPDVREDCRIDGTYRQFRKRILYNTLNGCWMVNHASMWFGIESDGYTHT